MASIRTTLSGLQDLSEALRDSQALLEGRPHAVCKRIQESLSFLMGKMKAVLHAGLDPSIVQFYVDSDLLPRLLSLLVWTLPVLSDELLKDPGGPTGLVWFLSGSFLLSVGISASTSVGHVEGAAAGTAVLMQLQPPCDHSKPGKQHMCSGMGSSIP